MEDFEVEDINAKNPTLEQFGYKDLIKIEDFDEELNAARNPLSEDDSLVVEEEEERTLTDPTLHKLIPLLNHKNIQIGIKRMIAIESKMHGIWKVMNIYDLSEECINNWIREMDKLNRNKVCGKRNNVEGENKGESKGDIRKLRKERDIILGDREPMSGRESAKSQPPKSSVEIIHPPLLQIKERKEITEYSTGVPEMFVEEEKIPLNESSEDSTNISAPDTQNTQQNIPKPQLPHMEPTETYTYANLTKAAQNRILYDYLVLNEEVCLRKWGIDILPIYNNLLSTQPNFTARSHWIKHQKLLIRNTIAKIQGYGIPKLIKFIQNSLTKAIGSKNNLNVMLICNLGFEKGIGWAAAKYSLNLFVVEFLMKNICQRDWEYMEMNEWFLLPPLPLHFEYARTEIIEIIKLVLSDGIQYASKRSRLSVSDILKLCTNKEHYANAHKLFTQKIFGQKFDAESYVNQYLSSMPPQARKILFLLDKQKKIQSSSIVRYLF